MSARRPRIPAGSPVVAARSMAGFTLVEVLVALGLVASVGTVASGAAAAMLEFARAARSEAAGLAAGVDKLEVLVAMPAAARVSGNDETVVDGLAIVRIWRVLRDDPVAGLARLEVTTRWMRPRTTLLTLVAVAP